MRAPGFWWRDPARPGLAARLLSPLSRLTARATATRVARAPRYCPPVPVICVGNLVAGGAGKTPTVIALVERLAPLRVAVVSRGHGGRLVGPVSVDPMRHSARDVGDEPLLLAAFAPVWVGRDRAAAARAAVADAAEVIVMDDGHQNPDLARSLSIVVADARRGFGNGRVMPAGPLREPVNTGLERADLLLTIGDDDAQARFGRLWPSLAVARVTARLEPLATGMDWRGLRVTAFAGIGHPGKFFATLRGLGAEIVHAEALDDHQPLGRSLLSRLDRQARAAGTQLVTTEKDAVRLPHDWRGKVLTLPVRLSFDDPARLDAAMSRILP